MKIYRGISSKYNSKPFVPSGCRDEQIEMMIREINSFVCIDYESIRAAIIEKFNNQLERIPPYYRNASPNAFFNYFLTLLFMNIKLRRNEIIEDFFSFQTELISALNGLTKINRKELGVFCWEETNIPLYSENTLHMERFQKTLAVSCYFQHLNHIFENRTPTLGLDWTEDINVAKTFGDIVVSINVNKYDIITFGNSFGLTSYKDDFNKKNKMMLEQKGYLIFWPWNFTIKELTNNPLGKSIEFCIEN